MSVQKSEMLWAWERRGSEPENAAAKRGRSKGETDAPLGRDFDALMWLEFSVVSEWTHFISGR